MVTDRSSRYWYPFNVRYMTHAPHYGYAHTARLPRAYTPRTRHCRASARGRAGWPAPFALAVTALPGSPRPTRCYTPVYQPTASHSDPDLFFTFPTLPVSPFCASALPPPTTLLPMLPPAYLFFHALSLPAICHAAAFRIRSCPPTSLPSSVTLAAAPPPLSMTAAHRSDAPHPLPPAYIHQRG